MRQINMIRQIRGFYDRQLSNPLSSGQIALWHALLHINNTCSWIEWFTAANLTLEALCGLSRQGISKARNVLKQEGLIDFKSNGTKATSYKLNILYQESTTSNSVQTGLQSSVQDSIQTGLQSSVQDSSTLNKQNKTKLNETKNMLAARAKIQQVYQEKIRPMDSPQNIDRVQSFLEEDVALEVILCAINVSARDGGRSATYVVRKLNDWKKRGVKTIDDAQKADEAWKEEFSNKRNGKKLENTGSSEYDNLGW
ncbi:DnaD domain protein [Enterococcus pseudoavium]|uniref:DnaD domain protein n=1 Tax=Enterococcus pseudoavium TaxID=44007 RepID=A0AAE4KXT6_9ENTE|nr:DnaD domain protein [Enterococcus pseudoavium]MDT2738290.1 DnaD domain protein [Enterococcus pseudoavium]